ncbi:mycothiol transferase [Amycolatopsis thermophila]|uniref:DUF664 domain-containing protein n=1 Tax=Amycolatopsis thermophila TaxID=206084 RepID=A0ABU0F129_9PSEU|nr:DUF664 domain-containing protein [Amycolatopsis thermophila]MDQ0381270.1 hypothetical protein [Amycolatopsis thermophila]
MTARVQRDTGPPPTGPGERDVLAGFLDHLRAAVTAKAEGVPEAQARAPGVPSGTNLLGLVKHLTAVERYWLLGRDTADWQATFHLGADETAQTILDAYRDTNDAADERIATWADLTAPGPCPAKRGRPARPAGGR